MIAVPASIDMVTLLGPRDAFLRVLEDRLAADIHVRGSQVTVTGEPGDVASAVEILTELITIIRTGQGRVSSLPQLVTVTCPGRQIGRASCRERV